MREYFTYGSVRGAAGNGSPYRVRLSADADEITAKTKVRSKKWRCPTSQSPATAR